MSVFYIGIRVYAENGVWKAETTSRKHIVCGNSEAYGVTVSYEGEGWTGMSQTLHITTSSLDGDQTEYTLTSQLSNNITLPAFTNATVARVHITRGDRTTTIPATITCEPSATDGSGIEDDPQPDIYNIMSEYMAQRRAGSQTRADALLAQLQALRETAEPAYPGSAYRLTAKRSERVTTVTGTLTLADDTVITITDDMITADSLKLLAEATGTDALIPGGVPSTELRVTLRLGDIEPGDLYEARLAMSYHIQRHDEHWCEIALGEFTITEAKNPKPGYADITAYDDMLKFTRLSRGSFNFTAEYVSLHDVVAMLASWAGVEYEWDAPVWAGNTYIKPAEMNTGIETGRDLLGWITQAACAVAMINPKDGKLYLKELAKEGPVESYTEGNSLAHAVSSLDYQLYEIRATIRETDWSGNIVGPKRYIYHTLWADGVTVEFPENLLYDSTYGYQPGRPETPWYRNTGKTDVQRVANILDPVVFTPGEIETYGDPALHLLDWVTMRTEAGDADFPITRTDWTYRGPHKIESGGMETVAGMEKTMAEKRNLGARIKDWANSMTESRSYVLMLVGTEGHSAMGVFKHSELHHFTHKELGTKGEW